MCQSTKSSTKWFVSYVCLQNYFPFSSQKLDFKFPLTVSGIHFISSSIGAYLVIKVLKLKPLIQVDPEDRWRRIFPMSFVFCINIVLGNVSLRYIPVSFMQTIKSVTPATTGECCAEQNFKLNILLPGIWSINILLPGILNSHLAVVYLEKALWLANLGRTDSDCWRDHALFYHRTEFQHARILCCFIWLCCYIYKNNSGRILAAWLQIW